MNMNRLRAQVKASGIGLLSVLAFSTGVFFLATNRKLIIALGSSDVSM